MRLGDGCGIWPCVCLLVSLNRWVLKLGIKTIVMSYALKKDPATAPTNAASSAKQYDEVAQTYEKEYEENLGWMTVVTTIFLPLMKKHVALSASILDAGCGTGALVQNLREAGYDQRVDGFDVSPEMINVCKSKDIFHNVYVHDMYQPFPVGDEQFDCVMTTAALLFVEKKGLIGEFVRCVKLGGHLFIASRQDRMHAFGYVDEIKQFVSSGILRELHRDISPLCGKRAEYRAQEYHYITYVFEKIETSRSN